MEQISIRDIIENTGGTLYYGVEDNIDNVNVSSVSSNSREITKGALFIPIIGEKVNAHKFIGSAFEQGAAASLISEDIDTGSLGENEYCIMVDDTLRAIQRLAAWYRRKYDIPVIGVTGSVGKTTTKEMISTALAAGRRVLKTIGNRNSQLGVALMMFEMNSDYDIAVIEMGISEPGEMSYLTEIAAPETAFVTNIGVSHIAMLGSRENIRREKLDIVKGFRKKGTLYVCGNDVLLSEAADSIAAKKAADIFSEDACKKMEMSEVYTYGSIDGCDYRAENITASSEGTSFHYDGIEVRLCIAGVHNVHNAMAALAAAKQYGVDIEAAARALEEYRPLSMRGEITEHNGITIIDDTYNASPDSMRSAMQVLWSRDCTGRKYAVLADALELGEVSEELHREVGRYIAGEHKKGNTTDCLVTVGEAASYIAEEVKNSANDIKVMSYDNRQDAADYLTGNLKKGDTVILKGSRGMKIDEIVEMLKRM